MSMIKNKIDCETPELQQFIAATQKIDHIKSGFKPDTSAQIVQAKNFLIQN